MSLKERLSPARQYITKIRVISLVAVIEAFAIIVLLAPYASPFVDGLERVATDLNFIHLGEGTPVFPFSPFPDYGVPILPSDDPLNPILSSIVGMAIVFMLFVLASGSVLVWLKFIRPRFAGSRPS
jgi:hypothetical protein